MSAKNFASIRRKLLRWYDDNKRDLPWRRTADPYAIWVAETMLQQTQVKTALPYYARFMETFPTVEALSRAPLQLVLCLWSGLGYYRRAEHLKAAAGDVIRRHGGKLPRRYDQLRALPGIGDYTAGAILSIAFQQPYPAIDGNARRVFSRLWRTSDERRIRKVAAAIVPGATPGNLNQALMELGATICAPQEPRCGACPVRGNCASRGGKQPAIKFKRRLALEFCDVTWPLAIVRHRGKILLRRRSSAGLLANLWELPGGQSAGRADAPTTLKGELGDLSSRFSVSRQIGAIRHSITHRRIHAPVFLMNCSTGAAVRLPGAHWRWVKPSELNRHAISSMTSKAVNLFLGYEKSPD